MFIFGESRNAETTSKNTYEDHQSLTPNKLLGENGSILDISVSSGQAVRSSLLTTICLLLLVCSDTDQESLHHSNIPLQDYSFKPGKTPFLRANA